MSEPCMDAVSNLRQKIDAIDERIIELLNARAAVAIAIGQIKRELGLPIPSPVREDEVIRRAMSISRGPMPGESLAAIYHLIISGSTALE